MVEILTQVLVLARGNTPFTGPPARALTNHFHFYYGDIRAQETVVHMATGFSLKADTQKLYVHTEYGLRSELKWVIYRTVW